MWKRKWTWFIIAAGLSFQGHQSEDGVVCISIGTTRSQDNFIKTVEDLEYRFLTGGNPDLKVGTVMAIRQQLLDHTRSDDVDVFNFLSEKAKR